MNTNDYVKFMTETLVKHFNVPKEERRKLRLEKRLAKPKPLYHWFGLLPISLRMIFKTKD